MKSITLLLFFCFLCTQTAWGARAKVDDIARDPYMSALVLDADTGEILFDDNGAAMVYPASVLKMMDMLVILELIEQGKVRLDDMVQVTEEAAQMGGSQVYLDPREQFPVEDLLYALAVQSANDAAVALAVHVAGSTEAFVALMNRRAAELGMKDTRFSSVHGLPPSVGQKPDETTAHDLALLSRELIKKQDIFEYTSIRERPFREGKFILRSHNHLLGMVEGCDGFKTGYFRAAGFSIVATAKREGVRIIAIVMGSKDRKVRDAKAEELLAKGFALVPPKPMEVLAVNAPLKNQEEVEVAVSPESSVVQPPEKHEEVEEPSEEPSGGWGMFFWGLVTGLILSGLLAMVISRKRSRKSLNFRGY